MKTSQRLLLDERDQCSATFMALAEDLEEQFGADRRERQIPSLIDDQQLDRVEMLLQR